MFNDIVASISGVYYLPASRSGLYQALSAFGQIIAELSKNRSFLTKKIELPGISEPVSDYFLKLSDIRVKKRSFEDKDINQIAIKIEEKILKGKVEFDTQTKQLMFYPENTKLKLELSSTSSMVSELAPIVSYLRYVLTRKSDFPVTKKSEAKALIMIEEPEAHLHPSVQLLLTEVFADLARIGIKVILTSHSNYIFNKVNNLIMSGFLKKELVKASVFKKTKYGSISPELDVNELGIEDDNFTKPTDDLYDEKISVLNKLNETYEIAGDEI
jgi:predicted ATPase